MWVYVLNVTSWVLTSVGFASMVPEQAVSALGPDLSGPAAILIGCAASAAVQTVLAASWLDFGIRGDRLAVITLILAAVFSGLSWYGSASSATALWGGDRIEREKLSSQGEKTSQPMTRFAQDYATLAAEFELLADESNSLAKREKNKGGTCLGAGPAQPKCGILCRHRASQSERLAQARSTALRLRTEAMEIATRMSIASSVNQQRSVFADAMALNVSDGRAGLSLMLRELIDELGPNGFVEPDGQRGVCIDPQFQSQLTRVLEVVERGVELPQSGPTEIVADFSDGSVCVRAALGIDQSCSDYSHAYFPMGLAGAIEFAAAFLLWRRGRRKWELGEIPTPAEAFSAAKEANLTEEDQSEALRMIRAFSNWSINISDDMTIIAVPIDGSSEAAREEAEWLCHMLGVVYPEVRHVEMSNLYPTWVAARDSLHGGANLFDWYEAPRDTALIIRRAGRRAKAKQWRRN